METLDAALRLRERGRDLLSRWSDVWDRPRLEDSIEIEVSRRMRRALGLTHPGRRLIRVSHRVLEAPPWAWAEVLCHEAAHVVVFERHRRRVRPHGPEWATLMRAAGYEPRTRIDPRELGIPWTPAAPRPRRRSAYVYDHRCPACGMTRRARRAVTQWRCARCYEAGRPGVLEIRRWRADAFRIDFDGHGS